MIVVAIVLIVLIAAFGGVLLVGAPYLPTLRKQIDAALMLADLKAGQTLLELGCGDGRVVLAAARKGYQVVGYELNPLLALTSWLLTLRYRKQVRIIWGDFWRADWPQAQAIFVFLLPKYMKKLDTKIIQYNYKPVKLISFAFTVANKNADSQTADVLLYLYK